MLADGAGDGIFKASSDDERRLTQSLAMSIRDCRVKSPPQS
jgi:hypothetical protein